MTQEYTPTLGDLIAFDENEYGEFPTLLSSPATFLVLDVHPKGITVQKVEDLSFYEWDWLSWLLSLAQHAVLIDRPNTADERQA